MRGNHKHYIDQVNEICKPWYVKVRRRRWRTTVDMQFILSYGVMVTIPAGTEWDMFSCVPNTGYLEFHKSSLLHDWMRRHRKFYSRYEADHCFSHDMAQRIYNIRNILLETDCDRKVVHREVIRLDRIAAIYTLGVSGKIGTIYIWLDKIF